MGARAVSRFGKADGAGAVGSEEEENMADEPNPVVPAQAGGPGDQPQPAQFAFKYKDKNFATEQELTGYLDGLATEITEAKKRPAAPVMERVEPVVTPVAPVQPGTKRLDEMTDEELVSLSLSNPKTFVGQIKEELRSEYRAAEQARENMRGFWEQFWTDNKELRQFEPVVKMVFDGNMSTLGPMQMNDAREKLAEIARSTVLTINKDAFQKKPRGERALIEGEGTGAAPVQPQEGQVQPKSLTQLIKQRRAAKSQPPARQQQAS